MNRQKHKNQKEIEELFFKSSNVSIEDMDKFEEKEMMKMRPFTKALVTTG